MDKASELEKVGVINIIICVILSRHHGNERGEGGGGSQWAHIVVPEA